MDYLQYLVINHYYDDELKEVLNLVINGLPSILLTVLSLKSFNHRFKPCYKWITFNIKTVFNISEFTLIVLNLVINGLPSIF